MPDSVKSLSEVDEVVIEFLLLLQVFLNHDATIEDLLNCASARSEASLFL